MKRRACLFSGLGLMTVLGGCSTALGGNSTSSVLKTTETQTSESSPSTSSCPTTTPNSPSSQTPATNRPTNPPTKTPTTTVQAYYEALYAGDADTANALLHEDSPISEHTPEEISNLDTFQYRLANIQENQTQPNRVTVSFTFILVPPDDDTQRRETTIEVKQSCSEWQIWK